MRYEILKNKVYLTLLAFYDGLKMPSFTALGKEIGITRQTASTKVKELIDTGWIIKDEDGYISVNNELNLNKQQLRTYLLNSQEFNSMELFDLLMAKGTIYKEPHSVVYGIFLDGKLVYVGSSNFYEQRVIQHLKKHPELTINNFVILADNQNKTTYVNELDLIHLLQPEWNIKGKERVKEETGVC